MLKIKILQTGPLHKCSSGILYTLGLFALCFSLTARADVLAVPGEDTSSLPAESSDITLPRRGSSKAQVEAQFGAPVTKHAAVGDPPISRWDYEGFHVFFEYQHVLHAVIPDKPKPIYNKEELQAGY